MTLVISVASKHGAWQVADRRYGSPASRSFLATKICRLDTPDSFGLIAYSGLGALLRQGKTPFELSGWIQKTLRGRKMSLDQTVVCLRDAAVKRKIASRVVNQTHLFQWVGFRDEVPTVESLGTNLTMQQTNLRNKVQSTKKLGQSGYGWERHETRGSGVLIATHGSGQRYLRQKELNRLIKLSNEARRSRDHARRVDAYLSHLVKTASRREGNVTVGPECVVGAVPPDGGGWHQAFDGMGHRCNSGMLPTLANGMPVDDIIKAMLPILKPHMEESLKALREGRKSPLLDEDALRNATESIDDEPDDAFPN